ncbi:MAG: Ribonuclease PH [candidate division WS2 bacterium]|uniref:Ribonuclease PH n=1 Tax=Psychracetigena formicireducens TaxID=2986056 RepID=A0A9E2BHN2_PSYF1|nr:Ribonuclease PH [Candidatus Psychracetigena formicireducens]MBT9151024.1 Ribonuclease PH [Candidatus Psychracetigena formicireducens]
MRTDGRDYFEARPVIIQPNYLKYSYGSALIEVGDTRVICTATIENRVPFFLKGSGSGWITAEYGMLPGSTKERIPREIYRPSGRTQEIQRLIGRSLRAAVELNNLGEYSITIDCDILQADGGTRTASVTGGYVALAIALSKMRKQGLISLAQGPGFLPIKEPVAAISVGMIKNKKMVDLNYLEDSKAEVDFNLVMTPSGKIVELQGTGENQVFNREDVNDFMEMGFQALKKHFKAQQEALHSVGI